MASTKAVLSLAYTANGYVLDVDQALAIVEILSKAQVYENKYHRSGVPATHHIYENENPEFGNIRILSNQFYQMAKLAGKPEDAKS